jgi:hypothetical protein
MIRTLALLIAACLLHAEALAQPATRRVFVDATAASGRAVLDLRADEFEITERGDRRDISSANLGRRPGRIVLVVDSTDAIRQPITDHKGKTPASHVRVLREGIELNIISTP